MASSGVEMKDSPERVPGIALNFPANDSQGPSSPPRLPRRLRRRLLEPKSPSTAEEIEAKLREADIRRQQFYELLSSKAKPKARSPSWSNAQEEELAQRLEAKLNAAEQKRLSILGKAQMRLARLDELRQAAKSGVEMRFEKERDQLGMKVESRFQQAEANRMLILKSHSQVRAARKERTAQSLMRRMIQESKYKECVRAAIHQKRAAAEKKRLGILEAERSKARARLLRVQRVANSVYTQREIERMKMKDQLEDRLLRAKRQRAEYMTQRRRLHSSPRAHMKLMHEQAELLARKLARWWRDFVKLRGSTYSLAKDYVALEINEKSVKSMPFEQLAFQIESDATLQCVKSLLERFEIRLRVQQVTRKQSLSGLENIDHLLKRVASPKRRGNISRESRSRGARKGRSDRKGYQNRYKLSRYPVRVVLCAYMILGHPDAVLSGKGDHENALAETASKFIQEFELLIKVILEGCNSGKSTSSNGPMNFRSQLEAFDNAWCLYLYRFVVWKVKDAKLLEEDLVRAACQLELSMMRTCKLTPEGDPGGLTHDMKAIQKQVVDDQRLLKEKVQNLSGDAGIERMECALSDVRSKFFASKECGSPLTSPVAHISSPSTSGSEDGSPVLLSDNMSNLAGETERSRSIARSLFKEGVPSPTKKVASPIHSASVQGDQLSISAMMFTENEVLVNEIVHQHGYGFADNLDNSEEDQSTVKSKVKETMEKAFWDGIVESVNREQPDFNWVLKLMTEVRDELCEMSPNSWRQEIVDAIDIDILSQVLKCGKLDMNYLGKILEFALLTLQKLSAPVDDDEMKATHQKLLRELLEISQSEDSSSSSYAKAVIKGLRFVLQKIQILKRDISKARIRIIEPFIKGPAGFDYLRMAFSNRYGPSSNAPMSLPWTAKWLSSVKTAAAEEWNEHMDSMSALGTTQATYPQGLPFTALRTGGSTSVIPRVHAAASSATGNEQPDCKGGRIDLLVRLGLLKLVTEIEGLTTETLPETLKLNFTRLRAVQSQLHKIIVILTSMLVLRQILQSENLVGSPSDMDGIISESSERLSELLERDEDVGMSEIVEAVINFPDGSDQVVNLEKLQARKEVVANMIAKSLKAGDTIFTRVSLAIYRAMRGANLGGSGGRGKQLAERELRRVGAAFLTGKVMEVAQVLTVMAAVSGIVHGAWYEQLLDNE
ncbi:hypothetical protein Ancab_038151 [Ancistrocladus abbreviatus]